MVPLGVEDGELLLQLAIVLAASNKLLRVLDLMWTQILGVNGTGLISIARGLIAVRIIVR